MTDELTEEEFNKMLDDDCKHCQYMKRKTTQRILKIIDDMFEENEKVVYWKLRQKIEANEE